MTAASSNASVLLFPGQGSQEIGMGETLWRQFAGSNFLQTLLDAAPPGLAEIRAAGPSEVLNQNRYSSAAILITSLLGFEIIRERKQNIAAALGYSVGQFAAMTAAGIIDASNMLTLVAKRAELMDREALREPQGMLAILGVPMAAVEDALAQIRAAGERIFVSNHNALEHITVAGTAPALLLAEEAFRKLRALRVQRVPVTGAWHSPFMLGAADDFARLLAPLDLHEPNFPVIDNVTALPMELAQLKESLLLHLSSCVRFYDGVKYCVQQGWMHFIEVGHGELLGKFVQFIDRRAKVSKPL